MKRQRTNSSTGMDDPLRPAPHLLLSRRRTLAQRLSGRIISLVSPLGDNYFLWISANLARLVALMEAMGDELADARFLVKQGEPFQTELLKTLLSIPDQRLLL